MDTFIVITQANPLINFTRDRIVYVECAGLDKNDYHPTVHFENVSRHAITAYHNAKTNASKLEQFSYILTI